MCRWWLPTRPWARTSLQSSTSARCSLASPALPSATRSSASSQVPRAAVPWWWWWCLIAPSSHANNDTDPMLHMLAGAQNSQFFLAVCLSHVRFNVQALGPQAKRFDHCAIKLRRQSLSAALWRCVPLRVRCAHFRGKTQQQQQHCTISSCHLLL